MELRNVARVVAMLPLVAGLTAGRAFACPVCAAGSTEENQGACLAMTVLLSGLPLGMIGGLVVWLARRAAAQDGADVRARGQAGRT
jgi:hypothetical protein